MKRLRPLLILLCLAAGGVLGWWIHQRLAHPSSTVGFAKPSPDWPLVPAPEPLKEAPPRSLTKGWEAAAPGLAYQVREAGGGLAQLAAVRVDLARHRLEAADLTRGESKPATVRALAKARGAVAAINGGYFDEHWHPLGALVHAGKQTNPPFRKSGGIFCIVGNRAVLRRSQDGLPAGATEALQCHPRLVTGGQVLSGLKPGEHIRSAVGLTAAGEVVLAVTGRGELSLRDWARAMKALGCKEALNLDGGPSSQLYLHAGKTELDLPGAYGVPSALVVLPR